MMKVFLTYLFLELKKSIKVLYHSAASLVLVFALIVFGVFVLGHTMFQSQIFHTIRVGVVMPDDASELQMITHFISSMDSVRSICSFDYMSEEDAFQKVSTGEVQAVILLPESLYQDIYTGQSAQVSIYFSDDSALNIQVFQELLNDGMQMLQSAEAGVFAAKDTATVYEAKMNQYEVAQYISYVYIEEAFDRGDIFYESVLLPFGAMDLYQYYIAAGLTILLMMLGVNFSFLYPDQNRVIEQKLRIMGLGAIKVSLIKVIVMSCILWIVGSCCYIGICFASRWIDIINLWFDGRVIIGMLILAAALSVYFHLIYSFFGKGYQGSVFILSVNIWMLVCSGALIPAAYMPGIVGKIGPYMPLNYLNQYCAELLFGRVDILVVLGLLVWIICVFMIGVFFLWSNISYGTRFSLRRG